MDNYGGSRQHARGIGTWHHSKHTHLRVAPKHILAIHQLRGLAGVSVHVRQRHVDRAGSPCTVYRACRCCDSEDSSYSKTSSIEVCSRHAEVHVVSNDTIRKLGYMYVYTISVCINSLTSVLYIKRPIGLHTHWTSYS